MFGQFTNIAASPYLPAAIRQISAIRFTAFGVSCLIPPGTEKTGILPGVRISLTFELSVRFLEAYLRRGLVINANLFGHRRNRHLVRRDWNS